MEAQAGGKVGLAYGPVLADMNAEGKRSLEWDLNDWRWDGDLLLATPYSPVRPECRNRQLFPARPETSLSINIPECSTSGLDVLNEDDAGGRRELEKRRRAVVGQGEESNFEADTLNLKLGGQTYEIPDEEADKLEGTSGKKIKVCGGSMSRPVCQVEDCRADLSKAKDYHRRHKVCEMHSKACQAMVGNVMQRFCQQCSRFHVLQEFDEGKRSCRRRLAGHNKRRRKTHPETSVNMVSTNDGNSCSYLLASLLRILTNLQSSSTDQKKDQDLLSHLLKNLASLAGTANANNTSDLAQHCEDSQDVGTSTPAPDKDHLRPGQQHVEPPSVHTLNGVSTNLHGLQQAASPMLPKISPARDVAVRENVTGTTQKKNGLTDFDLNSVYDESQDLVDDHEKPLSSLDRSDMLQDAHKSSQTSGNSDSTSTRSPSSSSGSESQSRTDRIIFKLFGKDPNDLPEFLRRQILDWLSHSPTNIEGYIRPGCIVLTIYLRLDKSSWQELCCNLGSSLSRLLDMSDDPFWRTGWIYTRVQNRVAFICNGQVVLDTSFPNETYTTSQISSISPLAVSASHRVQFTVRGCNLSRSTSRLFCGIEGKYSSQEGSNNLWEDDDELDEHDDRSCLRLSCAIPDVIGRGFIEVEDCSFGGSSFPFIVTEPDVCAEIRTLEGAVVATDSANETAETYEKIDARNQALNFLHEMGWLLHRSGMKSRSTDANISQDLFPFERVKFLLDFSVNRDWCAVVKMLLDIVFDRIVDPVKHPSVESLLEMGLLHQAVRRNSKCMVESLLRYIPHSGSFRLDSAQAEASQEKQGILTGSFLFRPDNVGPGGLTPLHIAASSDGCENVLEALVDDPGTVKKSFFCRSRIHLCQYWYVAPCELRLLRLALGHGVIARDDTGLTPNDYACLRGHYSYIHLVQRKINKLSLPPHVVVDIPATLSYKKSDQKQEPSDISIFQMEKLKPKPGPTSCRRCEQKVDYGYTRTALTCRPLMLSMLAIAAVCVCAALMFKSSPEVYVLKPFSWESLKYGVM
ncbi:Squamosa promoter-binding-like protein [Drosera capensis]